jgi:hypothetical protein
VRSSPKHAVAGAGPGALWIPGNRRGGLGHSFGTGGLRTREEGSISAFLPRILGVVLGFVVLLGAGYWLSRAGRPYGQIQLAIHKLIGVGLLVFVIWSAVAENRVAALAPTAWLVVSLAALSLVVLIGTGGALSATASVPAVVRWLHRVVPYVAIASTTLWLVLE